MIWDTRERSDSARGTRPIEVKDQKRIAELEQQSNQQAAAQDQDAIEEGAGDPFGDYGNETGN